MLVNSLNDETQRRIKVWSLLVLVLFSGSFMTACATHHEVDTSSPAEGQEQFNRSGSDTVALNWWTEFEQEALNELIDRALNNNFTIQQAWDRLAEARSSLRQEESGLYPSLDVSADYTSEKLDNPRSGQTETPESYGGRLSAQYEVDLWGRIESSSQAAEYEYKATRQDLKASAISVTAEVARTWFQLIEQYGQRDLLDDQIETNKQVLQLVERRFELGRVGAADVFRQRQLLDSTREQRAQVDATIGELEHQLSVLVGQVPDTRVNPRQSGIPEIPALPETGIPSKVIQRRPDVHAAFLRVRSADRDVAAAVANQYPRLDLTASISSSADDQINLFDDWIQSAASEFALPLIDGRQRRAQVTGSKARLYNRLNGYRESVLTAYQEIEDALLREQQQRKQIGFVRDQLKTGSKTVQRLRSQYINGTTDYLDVLDALENKQQLQRDLLSARQQLLEERISLYRAIAGGLNPPEPERFNTILSLESVY